MPVALDTTSRLQYLQCAVCDRRYSVHQLNTWAECNDCGKNPLLSHYDLSGIPKSMIDTEERSMWRYHTVLPVFHRQNIVTLGEGWTPLLRCDRLAGTMDLDELYIKDESANPTGSFKARGLSMAVSKAKELNIRECIVPTAGNAGGAMAAYCARAGMNATVVMPRHTPEAFKTECRYFGASLFEVDGLISDCAKKVAELNRDGKYFDLSTMKEPYRLEGKKTMGYELAEQLKWDLPDVILYPTGGGTGLIGLWKAFREMMQMGWVSDKMPRLIAVQSQQCMPVVEDLHFGKTFTTGGATLASGLAVPFPFARNLIRRVLQETSGTATAVAEDAIIQGVKELAYTEGLFVSPEGGALVAALKHLLSENIVHRDERILLLNTGSAYKYLQNL